MIKKILDIKSAAMEEEFGSLYYKYRNTELFTSLYEWLEE